MFNKLFSCFFFVICLLVSCCIIFLIFILTAIVYSALTGSSLTNFFSEKTSKLIDNLKPESHNPKTSVQPNKTTSGSFDKKNVDLLGFFKDCKAAPEYHHFANYKLPNVDYTWLKYNRTHFIYKNEDIIGIYSFSTKKIIKQNTLNYSKFGLNQDNEHDKPILVNQTLFIFCRNGVVEYGNIWNLNVNHTSFYQFGSINSVKFNKFTDSIAVICSKIMYEYGIHTRIVKEITIPKSIYAQRIEAYNENTYYFASRSGNTIIIRNSTMERPFNNTCETPLSDNHLNIYNDMYLWISCLNQHNRLKINLYFLNGTNTGNCIKFHEDEIITKIISVENELITVLSGESIRLYYPHSNLLHNRTDIENSI